MARILDLLDGRYIFRRAFTLVDLVSFAAALILPLSLLFVMPSSSQADPLFSSIAFGTGAQPRTMTVADLNSDGHQDLITPNNAAASFSVLLGNGDGTFAPKIDTPGVGANPQHAAAGDLNGDGKLDLAIAIFTFSNNVRIFLGNGDGTFTFKASFSAGIPIGKAAVLRDFDSDSDLDLAVACEGTGSSPGGVAVFSGNGDGTFGAGTRYFTGPFGSATLTDWIAADDLNADGRDDLVATNCFSNSVSVLRGNGDGTFQASVSYPTDGGPNTLALGDVNADGRLDVATANFLDHGSVSVLLGNGDGTLQPRSDVIFGVVGSFAVSLHDLSGDGHLDIVVTHDGPGTLSVMPGNGDGTFGPRRIHGVGRGPRGIAIGDLDEDGEPDLAVSCLASNAAWAVLNEGGGSFSARVYATGVDPLDVAVGDLNGDSRPDLATANSTDGTASVLFGGGDGSFGPATDLGVGMDPSGIAIADLNSDGITDIAVANRGANTVSVLYGTGGGAFKPKANFGTGKDPNQVAVGDLNGDGRPDMVTTNGGDNNVSVLLKMGKGDGFKSRVNYDVAAGPTSVAIGDVNSDGAPDLVVAARNGNAVSILAGNGDGTFQPRVDLFVFSPGVAAIGDLDADGNLDLAVSGQALGGSVTIFLGNGGGGFGFAGQHQIGAGSGNTVRIGDLNADGKLDLAAEAGTLNAVSILLGNGDGTFLARTDYASGLGGLELVDLNQDGYLDLVSGSFRADGAVVSRNRGVAAVVMAPRFSGSARDAAPLRTLRTSISPNPLNPEAVLSVTSWQAEFLRIKIFDARGRLVRVVADELAIPSGVQRFRIDGRSDRGERLASGVYFYRVESQRGVTGGRFVILK